MQGNSNSNIGGFLRIRLKVLSKYNEYSALLSLVKRNTLKSEAFWKNTVFYHQKHSFEVKIDLDSSICFTAY